jgi:hypothetical protein
MHECTLFPAGWQASISMVVGGRADTIKGFNQITSDGGYFGGEHHDD